MIGQRRPWEQCHFTRGGRACSFFPRDHASVFTPDGRYLIVASARPDLELWNVTTRRLEGHFEGHTGAWVEDAVISPDGTRLATYEKDWNDVYVWDVDTQQLLWQEESGISRISDVVFSPNSQHLYVAGQTGTLNRSGGELWQGWDDHVRVWDVASGKQLDAFGDDFYFLKAVALSPEGRYLFASQDRNLQIWDWKTETPIEHSPIPDPLAISRDGSILLSYADTGQIQIWDATALLPSKTVVTPHGKQIVTLGAVKRNQLLQNFPNPFNPETWIPFRLSTESHVTIYIYSPTGQLVRRLSVGTMSAGDYSSQSQAIYWDGRNQLGERVSSGVYLYTIDAGDFSATRKMLIRK